jgi:hypothetical protein
MYEKSAPVVVGVGVSVGVSVLVGVFVGVSVGVSVFVGVFVGVGVGVIIGNTGPVEVGVGVGVGVSVGVGEPTVQSLTVVALIIVAFVDITVPSSAQAYNPPSNDTVPPGGIPLIMIVTVAQSV